MQKQHLGRSSVWPAGPASLDVEAALPAGWSQGSEHQAEFVVTGKWRVGGCFPPSPPLSHFFLLPRPPVTRDPAQPVPFPSPLPFGGCSQGNSPHWGEIWERRERSHCHHHPRTRGGWGAPSPASHALAPTWARQGLSHHPPPILPLLPQVLHFFVGFGALLSPLIADPFLSENSCWPANGTANVTSGSHLFHASRVLGQHHAEARPWANQTLPGLSPPDGAGTRVSYAFWIMALINVSAPGMGWWAGAGSQSQSPALVHPNSC